MIIFLVLISVPAIVVGLRYVIKADDLSENNPNPEKNTPALYRISGTLCTISGIVGIVSAYILADVSFNEFFKYLAIAGIIIAVVCVFWFFTQKEKTKGIISLVVLALILVCLGLNSPSPDQTCWDCGREFVSYEDSNGFCKSCNEYHKNIVNNLP